MSEYADRTVIGADLRTRIAAVAQNHVRCDDCTFAKTPQERYLHFADAVIRELGAIPDRIHVDDQGRRWEWCGGQPETWAWRITRLQPMSDLRTRIAAALTEAYPQGRYVRYHDVIARELIRELEAGYVLVPKNVTLFQWEDEAFKDHSEDKLKRERITEWMPMTDSLRTRIAAVQREHRLTYFGANYQCKCGWKSPEKYATWTDHPEHVADAVIRELNLTEDGGVIVGCAHE